MADLGFTPHPPLPVEPTFDAFVRASGGRVLRDSLPASPSFANADYYYPDDNVLIELKSLETDFPYSLSALEKTGALVEEAIAKGELTEGHLKGELPYPGPYLERFFLQFRPPLQQILKKANKQLKETRHFLPCRGAESLVFVVNDGVYGIAPEPMMALLDDILGRHFSSIDGYVYITLNQYIDSPLSRYANLLWAPRYHPRHSKELVDFVNRIGKEWGDYLETILGPFDSRTITDSGDLLQGSRTIRREPPSIAG